VISSTTIFNRSRLRWHRTPVGRGTEQSFRARQSTPSKCWGSLPRHTSPWKTSGFTFTDVLMPRLTDPATAVYRPATTSPTLRQVILTRDLFMGNGALGPILKRWAPFTFQAWNPYSRPGGPESFVIVPASAGHRSEHGPSRFGHPSKPSTECVRPRLRSSFQMVARVGQTLSRKRR
jgi:hypothetical protein